MTELEIEQRIARAAGRLCPACGLDERGVGHVAACGSPAMPLPTATVHDISDYISGDPT